MKNETPNREFYKKLSKTLKVTHTLTINILIKILAITAKV